MTVEIKTIGCRQNQYESVVLKTIFEKNNPLNLEGDIVIINGCSVTSKAIRDTRKIIRKAKKEGKKVVVTGCIADESVNNDSTVIHLDNPSKHKMVYGQTNIYKPLISRPMISIETGCDEFCSYCIVPYLREKPFIRNIETIKMEIESLLKKGFFEFVITGTNIALAIDSIYDLLNWAEKNHPEIIFRLSSLDPAIIKENLEIFFRPNVAHTAHLSIQSLSKSILVDMKRRHNVEDIYEISEALIKFDSLFAVGGDLIVGFPTEGDKEFKETKNNVRNIPFAYLHVFEYSKRENTLASLYKSKLSNGKIKEHVREMHSIINEKKEIFSNKNVGANLKATILGKGEALTTNYLNVSVGVSNPDKKIVNLRIESVKNGKLYGKIT